MAESENEEHKPEELISEEEKIESDSEDDKQVGKLELRLEETASAHLKNFSEFWEEMQWNNYLYGAKEMDCFQLPIINACLSEWKDDDCFVEAIIFEKCRTCLEIIDELNFAISTCINATEKQLSLWREGIKNIQETIAEKLNYLSFMLLKDGEKYLSPKTENMEYGTKDNEDDCLITLCLWANLYTAIRKQGMNVLDFSFRLPMDIVQENCAVRIMHTYFNHVFIQKLPLEDEEHKEDVETDAFEEYDKIEDANEIVKSTEKTFEISETTEGDKEMENLVEELDDLSDETHTENITKAAELPFIVNENEMPEANQEKSPDVEEENQVQTEQRPSKVDLTDFDPSLLPPLQEPDMKIVDLDEYFIVGGVFHFELYVMPYLNVQKDNITYLHREKSRLRRIQYKRKIVPPRTLDEDMPYVFSAYEKRRFHHELECAIFVQFQLPKKVMYLCTPEPARLFMEKRGYSRDCIFCTDYKADSRQISFKTNQFGIFVMLQKKYQNLPYTKWILKGNDAVILSLTGSKLEIDIQISSHGYSVPFLHPGDDLILHEIHSTWMASDLFIQKLLSVGINIVFGEKAEKFADVSKKVQSLEDNVYDCMAVLCTSISFVSVSKCLSAEDEIVLEYIYKKEHRRVIIRSNVVADYDKEVKRIEKAKLAAERIEDLETENPNVTEGLEIEEITEEQTMEKDAIVETAKIDDEIEETEKEPIFCDLYNYLIHRMDETEIEAVKDTNSCLIENVRILLKLCRPISSM